MIEEALDNEMIQPDISEVLIEPIYPSVSDRVKAVFYDSLVTTGFIIVAAIIFSYFDNASDNARMITVLFIVVLYDPLFTSLFGGTVGHMMNGIRVKRQQNEEKNILFPLALIRFGVKFLLGWISLLTVTGNKKRKAIHDMLVGSVVVYKKKTE